jgi:hypothetical protein
MPHGRFVRTLMFSGWFMALALAAPGWAADRPIDFSRDIQPILSDNCFKCHGFDDAERQAGLRLDTEAGLTAPTDSGEPAITTPSILDPRAMA